MAADPAPRPASQGQLLDFVKMEGLGNDFLVVDATRLGEPLEAHTIRRLADRRRGVGFDQLMLLESASAPFQYRVFNADGGEVEQCGNGARCLARYIADRRLASGREFTLSSPAGPIAARENHDQISISLGVPRFAPDALPFEAAREAPTYPIDIDGERLDIGAVSVGNPHAVVEVASVDDAPVARLGPLLENHPRFPHRVNAGFVEPVSRNECRLRVHERGVGETPACGTGAAAAVVWGRIMNHFDARVVVHLAGGDLTVDWAGRGEAVWLTGPATPVFEGRISL